MKLTKALDVILKLATAGKAIAGPTQLEIAEAPPEETVRLIDEINEMNEAIEKMAQFAEWLGGKG